MVDQLSKYYAYLPFLLSGLVWALIATPIAGFLARRFGFLDLPPSMREGTDESKDRRKHRKPTPRLGGIVITLPILLMPFILGASTWIMGLAVCVFILNILALLDDKFEISAKALFFVLLVVSIIAVGFGICIKQVQNPFDGFFDLQTWQVSFSIFGTNVKFFLLAAIISVVWFLALSNAINWTDLMGGVASSISGLAIMVAMLVAIRDWNHEVAAISAVILGSVLGFLPFNAIPEKIFLGGGAMTLGFVVAILSVMGQTKISTWFLVLGLPIIDFLAVIVGRVVRSKPKSFRELLSVISTGDRTHLAHKLKDAGLTRRQVFWTIVGITFVLAIIALLVSGLMRTVAILGTCGIILLVNMVVSRILKKKDQERQVEGKTPEQRFAY